MAQNRFGAQIAALFKIVFSGVTALGILSVFALLYQYSGIHIENKTGATDYMWEPNQWKANMTEGFAWFHVDDNGFNNGPDAVCEQPDILLMGSSHLEAVQMQPEQTTASLLSVLNPEMSTYNLGMSGHTIYRCVSNLPDALKTYKSQQYVILETDTIELSQNEMQKVIQGIDETIPSYDSGLVFQLQKIPALKWLYASAGEWMTSADTDGIETFPGEYAQMVAYKELEPGYVETLNQFLGQAEQVIKEAKVQLIIFYHPTEELLANGSVYYRTNPAYLKAFEEVCAAQGIVFVDMTADFQTLYENEHQLAHGFSNTEVGRGHLNQAGHRVIAERLTVIMKEKGEK